MKYCSNCGTPLDDESRFCPNCGQKSIEPVAPVSQNEGTQMASEAPGEVVLSSWENPNPRPQRTPPQGGNTQPQGKRVQTSSPTDATGKADGKSKKKKRKGCGCIVAIVILLMLAVAAYYYYEGL